MGPPQTLQVARTQRDQVNGDRSAHRRHVIAVGVRSIQSTYCCSRTATCPRTATRTALPLVLRRDRRCSCAACPFWAGEFRRREEFLNGDRERQKGVCLYLSNGQCGSPKKAGRAMMLGIDHERNKAVTFHPAVTASLSLCVCFFWGLLLAVAGAPLSVTPASGASLAIHLFSGRRRDGTAHTGTCLSLSGFPGTRGRQADTRIQPIAPTKGNPSRWRRFSWPAFSPRAAAAVAPRRATGHGQAGGHVRGAAARLRVASSRFAVRSSAVLCGEGERKRPLLLSPAGHFRRAVGAALRRM